jgi:hypothetical protein
MVTSSVNSESDYVTKVTKGGTATVTHDAVPKSFDGTFNTIRLASITGRVIPAM